MLKMATDKARAGKNAVQVPGFIPLRNKQREYKNEKTGEVISKRQYQKKQAELSLGVKITSNEQAAKLRQKKAVEIGTRGEEGKKLVAGARHMSRYNSLVKSFKEGEAKRLGIPESKIRVRGDSDTAKRFKQLQKDLRSKDNSPNGRKARALVALGRRSLEWDMPVGESPK